MALMHKSSYHTAFLSVNLNVEPQERFRKCLQKMCRSSKYQYAIVGFIIGIYSLIVFNTMIGSFVFMNPIFHCNGQSLTEEQACQNLRQCEITNSFTAVYKNGIYCQKESLRSTIQSLFGLGYIIGKVGFPLLCDIIGRRACMLISLALGIAAICTLLLGIQYNSGAAMMMGQLVAGLFGSGISALGFIYVCDFCLDHIREICITYCWAVWGLAQMFFYVLYFYIPHWRLYLTATLLIPIAVIFIFSLYFQIQSPVYAIFVKKNPQAFNLIVDKVAMYNQISVLQKQQLKQQGRQIIAILKKDKNNQIKLKQILTKIFCGKKNLVILLCLIANNIGYVFFYYGMQGSMQSGGFNFGVNMFFVGLVEFFGYLIGGYVARKMRRKIGLFVTTILISVVGLLFLIPFVQQHQLIQTILIVVARLMAGFNFCFFILLESEILQVEIRNTCFALIDGTGEVGRVVAPYVINIMYNIKIHPIVIFSIVFIICGALPIIFLKQTYKPPAASQESSPKQNSQASALYRPNDANSE